MMIILWSHSDCFCSNFSSFWHMPTLPQATACLGKFQGKAVALGSPRGPCVELDLSRLSFLWG